MTNANMRAGENTPDRPTTGSTAPTADPVREIAHSPLPWRCEFREMGGYDCMTDAFRVYSDRVPLADLDLGSYGQLRCDEASGDVMDRARANAEFIVRACNSHDELLAALKETREACAALMRVVDELYGQRDVVPAWRAELRSVGVANGFGVRADAAIARAEGR